MHFKPKLSDSDMCLLKSLFSELLHSTLQFCTEHTANELPTSVETNRSLKYSNGEYKTIEEQSNTVVTNSAVC